AKGGEGLGEGKRGWPVGGRGGLDGGGNLGESLPLDDAFLLERPQAKRQRARADPYERPLQFAEPRAALGQIPDQEQRPFAAHDFSGATDGTCFVVSHATSSLAPLLHELKRP